ncbi:MAG: putative solute:sodium symporter small subunit [Natronomonas sp.]|jgi:putative solute:sodium symporter small subunit
MTDKTTHESTGDTPTSEDGHAVKTDGGVASQAAQKHEQTDYLSSEVNLLSPSTPFMREHLKLVWGTFIAWALIVWGPVTLTRLAPETMTSITVIGFPLHYFLVALGAPTGSLVLAGIYARQRDKLDKKYGIDHSAVVEGSEADTETTATDGGVEE